MNNSPDSPKLFEFEISPYRQGIIGLLAIPLFTLLFYIPHWIGIMTVEAHQPWTVAASMVLLFAVANSVLSLGADDINVYWNKSIYSFVALVVLGGLMAWAFSGLSIYEAKSFKWIYIVFTFGYLTFLSIISMVRRIIGIAQKQDSRLRGEQEN